MTTYYSDATQSIGSVCKSAVPAETISTSASIRPYFTVEIEMRRSSRTARPQTGAEWAGMDLS